MKAQLTSSRTGGGVVLDRVTEALGVAGGDLSSLGLRVQGQRSTVAVDTDRQTNRPIRLRLSVSFESPRDEKLDEDDQPVIALRQETAVDERDKARALTHEVQLGYEKFDSTVFIDNDSTEADVRRIFSKEATRQAAMRLLDAGFLVRISVHRVTATRPIDRAEKDRPIAPGPVVDALEDLLLMARAGGPKPGTRPTRRGSRLQLVAGGTLLFSLIYAWGMHANWAASWVLASFGLVVGGAVAIFSRPAIEEACAGDSRSGQRSRNIVGAFAGSAAALVFGTIMLLNGALDRGEPTLRHGVVISVPRSRLSKRGETTIVRWRDGSTSSIDRYLEWTPEYSVGQRVVEYEHPGALGFSWSYVVRDQDSPSPFGPKAPRSR